jgi:hypothetical protein
MGIEEITGRITVIEIDRFIVIRRRREFVPANLGSRGVLEVDEENFIAITVRPGQTQIAKKIGTVCIKETEGIPNSPKRNCKGVVNAVNAVVQQDCTVGITLRL